MRESFDISHFYDPTSYVNRQLLLSLGKFSSYLPLPVFAGTFNVGNRKFPGTRLFCAHGFTTFQGTKFLMLQRHRALLCMQSVFRKSTCPQRPLWSARPVVHSPGLMLWLQYLETSMYCPTNKWWASYLSLVCTKASPAHRQAPSWKDLRHAVWACGTEVEIKVGLPQL